MFANASVALEFELFAGPGWRKDAGGWLLSGEAKEKEGRKLLIVDFSTSVVN